MLFLAVTLGFFVENQREHYIEHKREKQYMQSMVEDLTLDTLEIGRISLLNTAQVKDIDTLLNTLQLASIRDSGTRKKLYDFVGASMSGSLAVFTQRTLSQLKNAGGLRLIRKKEVANLISVYDSKIQYLGVIAKSLDEVTTDASRISVEIFDLNYHRAGHDHKYELITYDPKIRKKLSNWALMVQDVFNYYNDYLWQEKQVAIQLMQLITKEYHLK